MLWFSFWTHIRQFNKISLTNSTCQHMSNLCHCRPTGTYMITSFHHQNPDLNEVVHMHAQSNKPCGYKTMHCVKVLFDCRWQPPAVHSANPHKVGSSWCAGEMSTIPKCAWGRLQGRPCKAKVLCNRHEALSVPSTFFAVFVLPLNSTADALPCSFFFFVCRKAD